MPENSLNKFFLSIVIPTLLAIVLFVVSFYVIIIPMFENSMMDRKKEMILELTNTAWSVLDEYNNEYLNGKMELYDAQSKAIFQIKQMRYGIQQKDYFWIVDHQPNMIMHPYREELNNTNLSEYTDSHENKLFVDAVDIVEIQQQGFIEYYWQWKDDTTRIVPKLSFVKGFEAWDWIIGTGIYLDDVSDEIEALKGRLFKISSLIIAFIMLTLIYVIRQSLIIENKRKRAEKRLKLSRQKYKSLVDASNEGTVMLLEGKVVFANLKFVKMFDNPDKSVIGLSFKDLFMTDWDEINSKISEPNKSVTLETRIVNGEYKLDVVISVSQINYANQLGYIVVVKNVSRQKQIEIGKQKLSEEIQTSLQLMNQPIKTFVKQAIYCELNSTIHDAALQMSIKSERVIFVKSDNKVIGVINTNDLNTRVLAEQISFENEVSDVMSSPVISISSSALLYEAILLFKNKRVSHLLVKDSNGQILGYIGNQECLEVQRNSLSYLIQQIEHSQTVSELKALYNQLPVLVNALVSSSDNVNSITRLITSVSDSICCRVIQLGFEQFGQPPCEFAFMALGSEGRSEQTLKTDQDNAIVYADGEEQHQPYFLKLAKFINANLNVIGYNNCKGEIMAGNIKWCQPLRVWKKYFTQWINSPDPQNILDSSIFFDLKYIFGHLLIVEQLKEHIRIETRNNGLFFYHLANSVIKFKPEIVKNVVNVKKVLLPIIGYVRANALYKQVEETNSLARLDGLLQNNYMNESKKAEIVTIYNFLVYQRINNQLKSILNNEAPENELELSKMTMIEHSTLKKILLEIQILQDELAMQFKIDG